MPFMGWRPIGSRKLQQQQQQPAVVAAVRRIPNVPSAPLPFRTSEANSDTEWSHYTVGTALLFKTASGKCISSSASPALSRFNVANVTVRRDEYPQAYVCSQTSMQPKEAKFLIDFLGFKNGPCNEDGYDADMGQSKRVCLPAVFGKQHCLEFELFSSK